MIFPITCGSRSNSRSCRLDDIIMHRVNNRSTSGFTVDDDLNIGGHGGMSGDWDNEKKKREEQQKKEHEAYCRNIGIALWVGTLIVFLIVGIIFGHYTITEEQYAVVTTFGKPSVAAKPGWNWKIPFVQRVTKVPRSIIGMPIGYDPETNESIYRESMMITHDFNFVNVDFYVEYRVTDPIKAVIHAQSYKDIIKNLAQSYIRDTVGVHGVDEILTTGKAQIQSEIEEQLKNRVIEEDIGYNIERVLIQDGELPTEAVSAAFKAVESAKQSMETKINNANKDRSERIPAMEAKVDGIIKKAEAYKEDRINEANGQVARFNSMYNEYIKYPYITKKRMFYETMEDILPDLKIYINGSNGVQTMLPLESFSSSSSGNSSSTDSQSN